MLWPSQPRHIHRHTALLAFLSTSDWTIVHSMDLTLYSYAGCMGRNVSVISLLCRVLWILSEDIVGSAANQLLQAVASHLPTASAPSAQLHRDEVMSTPASAPAASGMSRPTAPNTRTAYKQTPFASDPIEPAAASATSGRSHQPARAGLSSSSTEVQKQQAGNQSGVSRDGDHVHRARNQQHTPQHKQHRDNDTQQALEVAEANAQYVAEHAQAPQVRSTAAKALNTAVHKEQQQHDELPQAGSPRHHSSQQTQRQPPRSKTPQPQRRSDQHGDHPGSQRISLSHQRSKSQPLEVESVTASAPPQERPKGTIDIPEDLPEDLKQLLGMLGTANDAASAIAIAHKRALLLQHFSSQRKQDGKQQLNQQQVEVLEQQQLYRQHTGNSSEILGGERSTGQIELTTAGSITSAAPCQADSAHDAGDVMSAVQSGTSPQQDVNNHAVHLHSNPNTSSQRTWDGTVSGSQQSLQMSAIAESQEYQQWVQQQQQDAHMKQQSQQQQQQPPEGKPSCTSSGSIWPWARPSGAMANATASSDSQPADAGDAPHAAAADDGGSDGWGNLLQDAGFESLIELASLSERISGGLASLRVNMETMAAHALCPPSVMPADSGLFSGGSDSGSKR